jgi:hypothetical protein
MAAGLNIQEKIDKEISTVIKRSGIDQRFLSLKRSITYTDFLSNKRLMIFII